MAAAFWLTLSLSAEAIAQEPIDPEAPALLQADSVTFDEDRQLVIASGNVEVSQNERILLADRLTYEIDRDVITAEGDVSLLEPTGEALFADRMELTGDLREGAVASFRMLMTDRSRVAAADAIRVEGRLTEMRKVVFSPCELCETDPERPPLWQIRAERVIHDQEARVLRYRDARMEFFGLPIAYTPYFEHPDPTVDRKSGFLAPTFGVSDQLGGRFQIPYYWAISPHRDFTFEPIFTTREGPVLAGEYRARTRTGRYRIAGSAMRGDRVRNSEVEENAFRGHIDTEGDFVINENWRWGFDAQRASDDTYLRIFDINRNRFLPSEAFVEGFYASNYFAARTMAFQGLRRQDEDDQLPIIAPEVTYNYIGQPTLMGGRPFIDAGILGITRIDGRDSRRLSSSFGWRRPYTDRLGGTTELTAVVHTDAYATSGVDPASNLVAPPAETTEDDAFAGRVFPQLALGYRYPLARESFLGREVLEPRAQIVVGPNGGNPGRIPNEDSRDFEFDDTNLFRLNRFPGRDRVSSGQRIDYGLSYSVFTDNGRSGSAFFGQSYRINSDDAVPDFAGGDREFSDYVGSLELRPFSNFTANYRFRLDRDDFTPRRHELSTRIGAPALRLRLDYSLLNERPEDVVGDFDRREEVFARVDTRIARHWSVYGTHRRDLNLGQALRSQLGLVYHDECFLIDIRAERRSFRDRDLQPDTSVMVSFVLKHLGEFAGQ